MYEIKVPEIGFSVKEATVLEWTKNLGEMVDEGQTIVIVETDKVTVEIPALTAGVLVEIRFKKGEAAPVGAVLGLIATAGEAESAAAQKYSTKQMERDEPAAAALGNEPERGQSASSAGRAKRDAGKRKISPAARQIAERENVDLAEIAVGSGPGGRIVKEDVFKLVAAKRSKAAEMPAASPKVGQPERTEFVGWRKTLADRMTASAGIPQGATLVEVDVTDLADLIRSIKKRDGAAKITYLPFLMKAIQAGIEVTPEINAYCYDDGFVLQEALNIGVAVDVEEKLVVPVVKNVRAKSILELAAEIQQLAAKARSNSLKLEDVQDGTITITNLGPYDVYAAMPLILPPQTAIVAMGTVREQPGVADGSIGIRKKVMVTGVFDHRAVNGAPGARFLKRLKTNLENLDALILGLR